MSAAATQGSVGMTAIIPELLFFFHYTLIYQCIKKKPEYLIFPHEARKLQVDFFIKAA